MSEADSDGPTLDDLEKAWEERMRKKAEIEQRKAAEDAERLRQAYIKRRGGNQDR